MSRAAFRQLVKYAGESVFARLPRRVGDGSSLVLAYHNVIPLTLAGRGDVSLHLPVELFRAHLQVAAAEADLVSLPVLLAEHGRPGRRVAVTFDDAYSGCLEHGLPACQDAGVEPTVFVAPALLGQFAPWDLWAARGAWSEAQRGHYLREQRGVAADYASADGDGLPEAYRIGTLAALREALRVHRFTVGNHTLRHVNLGACTTKEAASEVQEATAWLDAHVPERTVPYLAYPYGIAPGAAVDTAVTAAFAPAFLVTGGWMGAAQPAAGAFIPRLNVPAGGSALRLRAQLRGWLVG